MNWLENLILETTDAPIATWFRHFKATLRQTVEFSIVTGCVIVIYIGKFVRWLKTVIWHRNETPNDVRN